MKIIDAHIHFSRSPGFYQTALNAGHENSVEHLTAEFKKLGVVMAVAMGSGGNPETEGLCEPQFPSLAGDWSWERYTQPEFIAFCAGLHGARLTEENTAKSLELFDRAMNTRECVGLKIYTGYDLLYPNDPIFHPFYELAAAHGVPVVFHTGDNAGSHGKLKYSHPLAIDDVAADFRQVTFVMAHYGNPFIVDATAVAAKNPNVFIDLSGLAVGNFTPDDFYRDYSGYLEHLRTWMAYLSDYERFMYGTDWPLVNLTTYLEVIRRLVPEKHHDNVFCNNALRVFKKLRPLLGEITQ